MTDYFDEKPLTLSTTQKLVAGLVAVLVLAAPWIGTRVLVDYRLADIEKKIESHEVRISQQDAVGHPDHERRISRLEGRADLADRDISAIKSQLDVAVAILQRLEKREGGKGN